MSSVGQAERVTQNRVIALFRDDLGYRYLGDWSDRVGNSNIEEDLLTAHLAKAGYSAAQISAAIYKLRTEADNPGRNEPGTGEINYHFLFAHLDRIGYQGWVGCEYKPLTSTEAGLGWLKTYNAV